MCSFNLTAFVKKPMKSFGAKNCWKSKKQAIANCQKANLGVILVPVIAKGINDQEVGDILHFAWEHMPAVRGVHFQPMSFFGRYEAGQEKERFTLPQLLRAIETQTQGNMKARDFKPAGAENAYCSFSGNFMKMEDGSVHSWHAQSTCGCGAPAREIPVAADAAKRAQKFVAKRWTASESCCCESVAPEESCCCQTESYDTSSLDHFLQRLDTYTLAVSAMTFMDAWNLDLERLRDCYIHVVARQGNVRLIPFCAYNLTSIDGNSLYRKTGA